jgi:hypothetical protein
MAIPFILGPRSWAGTLSDILFKLVLMGLAFAAASLLLRNALGIGAHVPLDAREGWNAYLAKAAAGGAPLYPDSGLMINNLPPLSFYIVGALSRITGDAVIAGRLVSLISFFAICGSVIVLMRNAGAGVLAALFASLFLAVALLAASNYVAMDDPELLGHALQLVGLSLILQSRRDIFVSALMMAAGLFVKPDLLALPLAAGAWLFLEDRKEGLRFLVSGVILCLAGLIAARLFLGADLIAMLSSPRHWSAGNFLANTRQFLSWATAALMLSAGLALSRHDSATRLVAFYAAFALILGGIFAFADGTRANIFFDTAIALSLGAGLVLIHLPKRWTGPLAFLAATPLAFYLAEHHVRDGFRFSEAFAREVPPDIGFIAIHPGPALCQDLTLCFWAEKEEPVDVFNLSQGILTGRRGDTDLARKFESHYFGSIVLTDLGALGPHLEKVMLAHYRVARQDDNGAFLEPAIPRDRPSP